MKTNSKRKFLSISLAHFSDETKKEIPADQPKHKAPIEMVLEGKILNQLLHQIDPKSIPQTIFKTKQKLDFWKMIKTASIAAIYGLMCLYLLFFDSWQTFVLNSTNVVKIFHITAYSYSAIVVGALLFALSIYIIYQLIKIQKEKNIFKKISIRGNELEVFSNSNESYFDKQLSEVLYLFDNSGVESIIFDDIDRFDNIMVF